MSNTDLVFLEVLIQSQFFCNFSSGSGQSRPRIRSHSTPKPVNLDPEFGQSRPRIQSISNTVHLDPEYTVTSGPESGKSRCRIRSISTPRIGQTRTGSGQARHKIRSISTLNPVNLDPDTAYLNPESSQARPGSGQS